jgi:hypothetical protein
MVSDGEEVIQAHGMIVLHRIGPQEWGICPAKYVKTWHFPPCLVIVLKWQDSLICLLCTHKISNPPTR